MTSGDMQFTGEPRSDHESERGIGVASVDSNAKSPIVGAPVEQRQQTTMPRRFGRNTSALSASRPTCRPQFSLPRHRESARSRCERLVRVSVASARSIAKGWSLRVLVVRPGALVEPIAVSWRATSTIGGQNAMKLATNSLSPCASGWFDECMA